MWIVVPLLNNMQPQLSKMEIFQNLTSTELFTTSSPLG